MLLLAALSAIDDDDKDSHQKDPGRYTPCDGDYQCEKYEHCCSGLRRGAILASRDWQGYYVGLLENILVDDVGYPVAADTEKCRGRANGDPELNSV